MSRSALGIPWQRRSSDACERILKRSPSPERGRDVWVTVETAHHARPSCEPLPKTGKKKHTARCQQSLSPSLSSNSVCHQGNKSLCESFILHLHQIFFQDFKKSSNFYRRKCSIKLLFSNVLAFMWLFVTYNISFFHSWTPNPNSAKLYKTSSMSCKEHYIRGVHTDLPSSAVCVCGQLTSIFKRIPHASQLCFSLLSRTNDIIFKHFFFGCSSG